MKNWIILTCARLRCWWLGLQYRHDHKQFRKGYSEVMCSHYIDRTSVKTLKYRINRSIQEWDEKHPYGPPSMFNEGMVMALKKIREMINNSKTRTVMMTEKEAVMDSINRTVAKAAGKHYRGASGGSTVKDSKGANRNQPCPCGSNRKLKRCCGSKHAAGE